MTVNKWMRVRLTEFAVSLLKNVALSFTEYAVFLVTVKPLPNFCFVTIEADESEKYKHLFIQATIEFLCLIGNLSADTN